MAPTHWQQCAMLGLGLCERRGAPFRNRPRPRRRPRPRKSISSQHFELMFRPGEEPPCRMADLQNVRLSRGFGRLKCREEMPFRGRGRLRKSLAPRNSDHFSPAEPRRANANRQISVHNSGKEIPTAAAAFGKRLCAVIPGNVFASRHQMPPCGSRRKSTRL